MKCSYRITNGRVIDPATGTNAVTDVYIRNSRIVSIPQGQTPDVDETIDATGCLVVPGLIDFHTHLNRDNSDLGIHPDLMTLPNGITAAVDAGSAGTASFEGFYRHVVCAADTTIKSFLHPSPTGIMTEHHNELPDPAIWDIARLEYLFEQYPDQLLGLKNRIGKNFSREFGLKPLHETQKLARRLGTAMCVHVVHPEVPYDDILSCFDKGDILCHCYQSKGPYSILDADGKVGKAARKARERGVIFDSASGRANYSFDTVRKALLDGFAPDVITTDVVTYSMYKPKVFSLLRVMSAYLAVGLPLVEVLRAVTQTPAKLMQLEGVLGTLAPGAQADVAVLHMLEKPLSFNDQFGNSISGTQLFTNRVTIKAGRCAFMQTDFGL